MYWDVVICLREECRDVTRQECRSVPRYKICVINVFLSVCIKGSNATKKSDRPASECHDSSAEMCQKLPVTLCLARWGKFRSHVIFYKCVKDLIPAIICQQGLM